jgi:hypothetical protein
MNYYGKWQYFVNDKKPKTEYYGYLAKDDRARITKKFVALVTTRRWRKRMSWKMRKRQEEEQSEEADLDIAHETAICRNPHKSSNWDSRVIRQLDYKDTFCQNTVSTKNIASPLFS